MLNESFKQAAQILGSSIVFFLRLLTHGFIQSLLKQSQTAFRQSRYRTNSVIGVANPAKPVNIREVIGYRSFLRGEVIPTYTAYVLI
jgi:hypothetical protein